MRLPGSAWLEWAVHPIEDGSTRVVQRARFVPTGVWGRAYWWALVPFHGLIFPAMLRRIVRAAERAPTVAPGEPVAREAAPVGR
jgi:hypothetical protein